ncbi:biotin carboxylase N-terminal domain-containing protein [Oricola sp.]|uniref:acetyl-CoA carboxylase biotin carboxylase subunit n=1 Tax=Oricola sp. TaxID=1979950 RepID=UPI0025E5B8F1|nr:biotin carboxylase N-terminal domain-containing protein [Oricola sp.]MCI5075485.1 ATP-grasp domain-containing protein [Oricola sp.]
MYKTILIANRGAVAARVMRTAKRMGREVGVVHSPADADLPYVGQAAFRAEAPGNRASESYLDQDFIIAAAKRFGADAIHPGYGFLSENPGFAQKCAEAGVAFIGPSPDVIRAMGEKTEARRKMAAAGLPMVPSSGALPDSDEAVLKAGDELGYPVLVKPANGGGGIGMQPALSSRELLAAVARARSVASRAFADAEVYLERLVERPRHIEFQIAVDRFGKARHFFERDCSVQRRHQKVIEEAGAPAVPRAELDAMGERAAAAVAALGYSTIGTVEMLYHPDIGFSFLEMNTRLQVEHGVTEEVTGTDLVEIQIRLAEGEAMDAVAPRPKLTGHSVQARIYAEDPKTFLPSPGAIADFDMPEGEGIRVDTGFAAGTTITPFYDPMIAKVIATGTDRPEAIAKLSAALRQTRISGPKTNIPLLLHILQDADFVSGRVHTGLISGLSPIS